VLIAHLDSQDLHHERAGALLLEQVEVPWGASPVTLAEVLVGPARAGAIDRAQASLKRLNVVGVNLNDDAPERLARLRAATGLKLPDCCVILAAEQRDGCVATFDEDLATAARQRGLAVEMG